MASELAISAGMQVVKSGSAIFFGNLNIKNREDKDLRRAVNKNEEWIKSEMEMLSSQVGAGHGLNEKSYRSKEWHLWAQEVRELKYKIEDCIVSYKDRVTCRSGAPWYRRKLHQLMTLRIRTRYAKLIAEFREDISDKVQQGKDHTASTATANGAPSMSGTIYTKPKKVEGIVNPKNVLLELLDLDAPVQVVEGQPEILEAVNHKVDDQKLKVVSVVGFAGLGKTTLADAVFYSIDVIRRFPRRAWVVASSHDKISDLLMDIINQFHIVTFEPNSLQHEHVLAEHLNRSLLNGPRYFIVIDDLQTGAHEWDAIKSAFPTKRADGRIIVTTRLEGVARMCSTDGGHVHQMQTLNRDDSRTLFLKEVFGDTCTSCTPEFENGLGSILNKCEGWPLALIDIAQLVKGSRRGAPTGADCQNICKELGSHLGWHQTNDLARTRQVIVDSFNFNSKDDEHLKTCLVYASIYQNFRRTKWKSLLRRLSAEDKSGVTGAQFRELLAKGENSVTRGQIEELFNRCIIHRQCVRQNSKVKTYQIGHVLLEFMICKQAYGNFITLIHNGEYVTYGGNVDSAVRRLYLSGETSKTGGVVTPKSLSSIRSLTISEHNGDELVDFNKCKMLRVLDVENCQNFKDTDLQKICKLLYLNYLNLRGTNVKMLPRKASKLHYLQILDMRETNVHTELPMEVLILGQLVHLFGRFKLPPELSKVGAGHALMKRSKLKTFAGFILDDCKGFQPIMSDIKTLMKVKIWSGAESTQGKDLGEYLVPSLQKRFTEDSALESLSVDFGNDSIDFLDSLQGPCALESIKLHGKLIKLPGFFFEDGFVVRELQLSKTGLSCEALSALQNLNLLLYLKLDEDSPVFAESAEFTFCPTGFKSLKGLCFQIPKLPNMDVKEGALPVLESLQLFSENIEGLNVSAIQRLQHLKEVTFRSPVDAETREIWEDEAKKHKNRPTIAVNTPSQNKSQGQANN